jgi:DNA-binding response OmpR family regulator
MYFVFVDNDIDAARLFESILHEAGIKKKLITVPNGFDLIQFLQNVKKGRAYPELIVLTPKFLRIGGMDLLELLKTDDLYRLIPVFMLLPENNDEHEALCKRLGTEFMVAPHSRSEWLNAINKMCAACS